MQEILYLDGEEYVATNGSVNGRDIPPPPSKSKPGGASENQKTNLDRQPQKKTASAVHPGLWVQEISLRTDDE